MFVFLSTVVATMWVALAAEQAVRHHDVLVSLRMVSPRAAVAQPLLLALGYFLALWLIRPVGSESPRQRIGVHVLSAVAAVLLLGIISVFSQGTRFGGTVAIATAVGVIVGLVAFSPRVQTARTV